METLNKTLQFFLRNFHTKDLANVSRQMSSAANLIAKEKQYNANNYAPLPVVISRGQGAYMWDVDGKKYIDFLAGFATLNLGHSHPKILNVLIEQAKVLSHTSRAIHNDILPEFAEYVTKYFNFDRVVAMNTGVEGAETSLKIARRWGYRKKKIPENQAVVVFVEKNFWGRTLSAISTSNNPVAHEHYGPYMPGFQIIPYNDLESVETALKNPNVCAFMIEPIQGEAGVIVPNDGYLKEVRRLCTKHNVLWIADEIQTGLGRTGALLAVDYENVKPDILIIGKGLGGGFIPISGILSSDDIMSVLTPGSHGSTFGGNPLAAKLAISTLKVIKEEGVVENSRILGEKLRKELRNQLPEDVIPIVRGKGLMNALVVNPNYGSAMDLSLIMMDLGLITKPCDDTTVRLTPALIMTEADINEGIDIIIKSVNRLKQNAK
ncbi:ornithine aminotransferase, mitochondrial isoform X1 [Halyomorpha halys]|uniref:ornithine aminotransferase, mitochondrial isoform X1 n=2 Tax=Halyomorpha halys TaxID=286706 RepID=UPI0006D50419|nr:ornithine aminotransferase, mitochondrial [Halyomorpha halys]